MGFNFDIKVKFIEILINKLFIFLSLKEEYFGIEMYYLNGLYFVKIVFSKYFWSFVVLFEIKVNVWYMYCIEWSLIFGFFLYVNNVLVGNVFVI